MDEPPNDDSLLTPGSSEEIEDRSVESSRYRVKRTAYVANYYEKCVDFMNSPDISNLRAIDKALNRVNPEDIIVAEAEKVVQKARPLLDLDNSNECILWTCQLVVKFQALKPESQWMGSIDVTDKAASSFRDVCFRLLQSSTNVPSEFTYVIDSWTSLVKLNQLEEHHSYPLLTVALQWIFSGCDQQVRRAFTHLVAASYAQLPVSMREQVVHDTLSAWVRRNTTSSNMALVELVLSLIAVAGQVPSSIWEESVTIRSRVLLENEANNRHSIAFGVANLITRRLIDFTWGTTKSSSDRIEFQQFLAACAKALASPQWTSAELFISAFVSSLFQLANVLRSHKYAGFLFESLIVLNDALSDIACNEPEDGVDVTTLVSTAIFHCMDDDQAAYLASRQCVLSNQPFFDYFDALTRREKYTDGISVGVTKKQWFSILAQYPIASYHSKIKQMVCELASREDLRDQTQVDIFHMVEKFMTKDSDLFRPTWLDRLGYATPAICESLVPLVSIRYNVSKDPDLLKKASARIAAPGASQFKRRMLAVLNTALRNDCSVEARSISWRFCLIAITDGDPIVQTSAATLAKSWFNLQQGSDLAETLVNAQIGVDAPLVQRGLRALVKLLQAAKGNEINQVRKLVKELLNSKRLDLALVFIRVDGGFTPLSHIQFLFDIASSRPEDNNIYLQALKIIEHTLNARPRVILVPSLAATMFSTFLNRLKTGTHLEIDSIGSILGQLVSLGSPQVQKQRQDLLKRVGLSAMKAAENNIWGSPVLFEQSVMISGCIRFWGFSLNEVRDVCFKFLDWYDSDISLNSKLVVLRTLLGFANESQLPFSEPRVDGLFRNLKHGSPESSLFIRTLLNYMWNNGDKNYSQRERPYPTQKFNGSESYQNGDVPPMNTMLQTYLSRLIDISREEEDIMVLKVLVKAVEDNLLVADECMPIVTSLCFSSKIEVSQTALRSFFTLCERWPKNAGTKFVEGLKLVGTKDLSAPGDSLPFCPLKMMWKMLKESSKQRNIKPLIDQIAQLFRYTTSFALLSLLITGLMEIDMDIKDAKHLSVKIEDEVYQFDPLQHGKEDVIKTIISYIFVIWIKRRYGLSEHFKLSTDPDENIDSMDFQRIWDYLSSTDVDIKDRLQELWRLPDWYGTPKMNALVYGKREKKFADSDDSPETFTKKRRI